MPPYVHFLTPAPPPPPECPELFADPEEPDVDRIAENVLRALELVIEARLLLNMSPLAHNLDTARASLEAFAEAWRA